MIALPGQSGPKLMLAYLQTASPHATALIVGPTKDMMYHAYHLLVEEAPAQFPRPIDSMMVLTHIAGGRVVFKDIRYAARYGIRGMNVGMAWLIEPGPKGPSEEQQSMAWINMNQAVRLDPKVIFRTDYDGVILATELPAY